ncbi:nitrite reductase large subunit NirB [Cohnella suwonensis]|uniref:Nitrite reductase large subunit NirB n=1 Tax=Cohnella suwonensis TaxID=696072 RepID=A0ABW0LWL9_9BACL
MSKMKLVVVGNGMAGVKCVEYLLELAPDAYEITIIGNEPHPNYNRILLSKVLQGDTSIDEITINDRQWYKDKGIRLITGETVSRIDTASKKAIAASGMKVEYDKLVLAVGSSPFMPPIPGIDKPGVTAFRNIEDCETMFRASATYRKAAVIGGGLLGLEAARGLLNLGMEVDVVHNASYLMNRQLDRMSADMLKTRLVAQGMRFRMEKRTEKILGRKRAEGLQFSDGSKLAADLIVLAVGISPNSLIAAASGIDANRGIVVNDYMETSAPDVYAVGECAEHRGTAYGLVAPLYEQGMVLANVLAGKKTEPYAGSIPYAQLKVSGVEVFSAGDIRDGDAATALLEYDGVRGTYKKVTMSGGKVAGAILFGDTTEGTKLLGHLKKKADVSVLREAPVAAGGRNEHAAAAALADDEVVCACNGVRKDAIVCAVADGGAKTADDVREKTKASGSCGGCKPMVAALVAFALSGGAGSKAKALPICGCTELGHEAVKAAVAHGRYADAAKAMRALGWGKENGCPVCRSALTYYTRAYRDTNGERNRIPGRAGASATVRIGPGGGEGPRREFARDNEKLGHAIERSLSGLSMPYPVVAAVSAGPSFPAGSLVSDFGLAGTPAGWEVYAGGHSENPVKQGKLVGVEATEESALQLAISCVQWYRESANYGEAAWKWVERTGLQRLRETLLDPGERADLVDRLGSEKEPAVARA